MAPGDPYRLLGIRPEATDGELRAAYRHLVQRHHPDHNGGSAEAARRFEEIQDAYAEVRRRRARAGAPSGEPGANRSSEPVGASGGDPAIEARLAALESEVRAARAAAQRAAAQRAAAQRAAAERAAREASAPAAAASCTTGRPSDEELGYVRTDDSFARILADARGELGELLVGAREKPLARRVQELIDEVTDRLEGRR